MLFRRLYGDCDVWFLNAETHKKVFLRVKHDLGRVAELGHFGLRGSFDLFAELAHLGDRQVWQQAVVKLRLAVEVLHHPFFALFRHE